MCSFYVCWPKKKTQIHRYIQQQRHLLGRNKTRRVATSIPHHISKFRANRLSSSWVRAFCLEVVGISPIEKFVSKKKKWNFRQKHSFIYSFFFEVVTLPCVAPILMLPIHDPCLPKSVRAQDGAVPTFRVAIFVFVFFSVGFTKKIVKNWLNLADTKKIG